MKQKLLELLTAKFLGKGTTRKDTLARLASAFATQCTTEEEAQALIDKVTVEQVTDFEKEHRSEVDSEIAKATKTALDNAEKSKGGEGAGNPEPKKEEGGSSDPTDIASIVAAAIKEANAPLLQEIANIKAGKTTETRLSRMEEVLKDVNPELKAKTLKDFGRMSFENDDSFEEYLTETTTDIQTINQTIVNQGLAGHQPGNGGAGKGGKLSEAEYDDMV
ncbi:MAG TPA: hypothetical protein DCR77_08530 [Flavobacteriaceae bacterium]|nr:hypothetical protein [Flavobacteriaceae bacterium]